MVSGAHLISIHVDFVSLGDIFRLPGGQCTHVHRGRPVSSTLEWWGESLTGREPRLLQERAPLAF